MHQTLDPTPGPATGPTDRGDDAPSGVVPNHHADHPGFAGPRGLAMGLLFAAGGRGNATVVADLAGVGPDDVVVDIGCGPGTAARRAAARGARAVGVDPSSVLLSVARTLTVRRRSALRWAEGTAESLPVESGTATVAWSLLCVHHWADLDAGLHEVHRVLGAGGRFLAVERRTTADATGVASHGWTPEQADVFASACEDAGFVDVAVSAVPTRRGALLVVASTRP